VRPVVISSFQASTTDKHRGELIPVAAGSAYPSPPSPEHQFEWPAPAPQFHHVQANDSWMTDTNAQCYQPNNNINNQQPFFTTPNFDPPQMAWPRHDSFYPVDTTMQNDSKPQVFNVMQNQDPGLPSGVTMVPRNNSNAFSTHSAVARRDRPAGS